MHLQPTVRSSSGRVLVADDQPHILAALEILLNSQGYQTRAACDPDSVLAALQEETFDAVLMDLNYTRDTTGEQKVWDWCREFAPSTRRSD